MKITTLGITCALLTAATVFTGPTLANADSGTIIVRGKGCSLNSLHCARRSPTPGSRCFYRSVRSLDGTWRKVRVCTHGGYRPGYSSAQ